MIEENTVKNYDIFSNYTYNQSEWSAPYLYTVKEIEESIKSLMLVGRKIKHLKAIGLCYNLARDGLEEYAYSNLSCPEEERRKKSEYNNIDANFEFARWAEIDEPFMIEFEDGDTFEIDALMENKFRMSLNHIPWSIDAGTNLPNADADILFSPCVGKTISCVEVLPVKDNPEYADSVIIWIEDNRGSKSIGLSFRAFIDYCHVHYLDYEENNDCIKMKDLKTALYNYEDLHWDENIGFEASTGALFFGEKGKEHAQPVFITLCPGSGKSTIHISYENNNMDFLPIAWSIMLYTKKWFDEYDDYEFTYSQWKDILKITSKILSFNSFDEFFDYMVGKGIYEKRNENINIPLWCLNRNGALFWNNKELYIRILNDLKVWTEIVLGKNDTMSIYGF